MTTTSARHGTQNSRFSGKLPSQAPTPKPHVWASSTIPRSATIKRQSVETIAQEEHQLQAPHRQHDSRKSRQHL